jgi:hypothetical protein
MDLKANNDLIQDVMNLMDSLDEAVWNKNGLFNSADLVGVSSGIPPCNTRSLPKTGDINGPCIPSPPGNRLKQKSLPAGGPPFTNCSSLPRKGDKGAFLDGWVINSSLKSPQSGFGNGLGDLIRE